MKLSPSGYPHERIYDNGIKKHSRIPAIIFSEFIFAVSSQKG
jgi:hypothetical protein